MGNLYIRKVKRGKGDGLWGTYLVDEDEHGRWFFTPEGSRYRGTATGKVAYCYAGWPEEPGIPVIHLVPTTGWWFARWAEPELGAHVAIDLATPGMLVEGNVWSYDDLELDLFKFRDGRYGVVDEDEFEEAIEAGFIDDDERRTCLSTCDALHRRLADGDELFDEIGWRKLAECVERPFAPLTDFPD
jgi:hypothetical protein